MAVAADASPREIRNQIDAVARLLATDKPEEASAALARGIAGLEAMAALPRPHVAFRFLADRAERARQKLERAGVDVAALGDKLQRDGAAAFVKSWDELIAVVADKSRQAAGAGA